MEKTRLDQLSPTATLHEIAYAFVSDYIVGTLADFSPIIGDYASDERGGYIQGFAVSALSSLLLANPGALANAGFAGLANLHA